MILGYSIHIQLHKKLLSFDLYISDTVKRQFYYKRNVSQFFSFFFESPFRMSIELSLTVRCVYRFLIFRADKARLIIRTRNGLSPSFNPKFTNMLRLLFKFCVVNDIQYTFFFFGGITHIWCVIHLF